MSSRRHQYAIARIRHDARKLTRRERERLGLAPSPVARPIAPPPFPSDPSAFAWFALATLPQQEGKVAHRLARYGWAAFNPTEIVLTRHNRMARHKRAERERAILASTVLVGFAGDRRVHVVPPQQVPDGNGGVRWSNGVERHHVVADVPWCDVRGVEGVIDFIGFAGEPCPVPLGHVIALHFQHGRRASTRNWTPAVSEIVEVTQGPFRERAGRVVELTDGLAKVMLFGEGLLARLADPLEVPEVWLRLAEPCGAD